MSARQPIRAGAAVAIRLPVPSDRDELLALRRRSWPRLRPWEPTPPRSADPTGPDWFARLLAFRRSDRHRKCLVCLLDGTIIGCASLNDIVTGVFRSANAGWWIGDPHEGRGLMAEGIALLLEHAFLDLRLHRVEANIRPENERSLALVRRLGFRREGCSPRSLHIGGAWRDHERWVKLVEDWRSARRAARRQRPT
jgi:ribosomal-protein-alanine N-acetyltransferase